MSGASLPTKTISLFQKDMRLNPRFVGKVFRLIARLISITAGRLNPRLVGQVFRPTRFKGSDVERVLIPD